MNIHEHQAKQILKKYGAVVPEGIFGLTVDEVVEKAKSLKTKKYVLKAQIHEGGRGKAGGVKILNSLEELRRATKELLGKTLVTHQTGAEGRVVKRLYVEESSNIEKEFYLSCLVDRASSKIAFISSDQGGMDIEEVAKKTPEKIITTKLEISDEISDQDQLALRYELINSGAFYITSCMMGGKRYLRTVLMNPLSNLKDYRALAEAIEKYALKLLSN